MMGHEGYAALYMESEGNRQRGNCMNKMGKHWMYVENKFGSRRWEDQGDIRVMWWEPRRMLLQTAGEAHFRKSVWRWLMDGRGWAEKQQGIRGRHSNWCVRGFQASDRPYSGAGRGGEKDGGKKFPKEEFMWFGN